MRSLHFRRRPRHPRTPAPDWWGPACTCTICVPRDARADLHATLRAEGTRYDVQWGDVLAAEVPGGDLAAMAAPLPGMVTHTAGTYIFTDVTLTPLPAGMARDDLGTYAEPVKPRGRHRQTDPLDLILADLRDLGGL